MTKDGHHWESNSNLWNPKWSNHHIYRLESCFFGVLSFLFSFSNVMCSEEGITLMSSVQAKRLMLQVKQQQKETSRGLNGWQALHVTAPRCVCQNWFQCRLSNRPSACCASNVTLELREAYVFFHNFTLWRCFSGGMAVSLTSVADINDTSYEGLYQLAKDFTEIESCQCDLASNHFFFLSSVHPSHDQKIISWITHSVKYEV